MLNSLLSRPALRLSVAMQSSKLALWSTSLVSEGSISVEQDVLRLERLATQQDRDALETLLRMHTPKLVRFCASIVGSSDATDVTQKALERIVKNIDRFSPEKGRFKTWAFTIARNLCLDHLRARKAKPTQSDQDVALVDERASTNPERTLSNKEQLEQLQHALNDMPEGMRTALTLFHVHGESYEHIASILDVPKGTVMTWLHRGRKKLQKEREAWT